MKPGPGRFAERCEEALCNAFLREKLRYALDLSVEGRLRRAGEVEDWDAMRDWARELRLHTLESLDLYLDKFVTRAEERGTKVFLAPTAEAARAYIVKLALARRCGEIAKSKSMVTEEIGLRDALEAAGITVTETDLGEYIVQLAGERPSHITGPATHKSRRDIGKLLAEELDIPYTDDPATLTAAVRERLRDRFLKSELGISGANFLVAETGSLVIIENEGNARLTTSLPPVHVAVTGIEKVVPRLSDLHVLLQLVPGSNTGQAITAYTSLITGPRGESDTSGPEELHIVLVDSGRTELLGDPVLREALMCVRCAACLNVCPVYRRVGGHAYGKVYSGPIGKLIGAELEGWEAGWDLAFGSTLCGACEEACPVRVRLPAVLLRLREKAVVGELTPRGDSRSIRRWAKLMRRPRLYRAVSNRLLRFAIRRFPNLAASAAPGWTATRELPEPARESFADMWRRTKGFSDE